MSVVGCSNSGRSGGGSNSASKQLSVYYWGSDSRATITNKVFDVFAKKYQGLSAKGQFLTFNNYFDKLATLAASDSVPDIIQMNPGSLSQYSESGQLLDLSTLSLDLGDYQPSALASGQIQGKQFGLAFGYQYVTTFYNTEIVQAAGIPVPTDLSSTWDDWVEYSLRLQAKLPSGIFAMTDGSSDSNAFESWIVGRGKSLFTEDGKLGYDVSDAADWFNFWTGLRAKGAIAPAAETVTYIQSGTVTDSPFTKGKAALSLGINVGFQGYQQVNKAKLDVAACPAGPDRRCESNHFFGWSVSAKAKNTDAVKKFFELWFTDPEVIKLLGTDRALPASADQLAELKDNADPATKRLLDFSIEHPEIKPFNPPATPAAVGNEQSDSLQRAAEAVLTGTSAPDAAAQQLVDDVTQALTS
jgi:multiple sugar transport system substrate-binding protein